MTSRFLAYHPFPPLLPNVKLSEKEVEEMRNYSRAYGAAVRQRTNRQKTTMVRHGTMPEVIYQRQLHFSERVNVSGVAASPASTATDCSKKVGMCSLVDAVSLRCLDLGIRSRNMKANAYKKKNNNNKAERG